MDDTIVSTLEHAIADLGGLLVQMDKFRAGHDARAVALRATVVGIGDRARRGHRHGTLDTATGTALLHEATQARLALETCLAEIRSGADFAAARRAYGTPAAPALGQALVRLFDATHVEAPPAELYYPVTWQRRGRPLPAETLVDEIRRLRADGLAATEDALAPGQDPGLPGIRFHRIPPPGEPVSLVYSGDARPPWVLGFEHIDDVIAPAPIHHGGFEVRLADPDPDEVDEWVGDPVAYLDAVADALRATALPWSRSRSRT